MSVEANVQAILVAASGLTALCPAARIKVRHPNYQNLTRPYVIHWAVAAIPTRDHAGLEDLCIWPFYQVDVFTEGASAVSDAIAIAKQIRLALDGKHSSGLTAHYEGDFSGPDEVGVDIEHRIVNFWLADALS